MPWRRVARIGAALVIAALLTWGVIEADRLIMGRHGLARGTLLAAAFTGFVFFVASVVALECSERWRR